MRSRWFQYPFCQSFPMAHLMREAFPESWLRIHSLPDSKRYPEDDEERQIVLDRHARFGSALLGPGASCLVIQSRFHGFERAEELLPELDWTPIHRVGTDADDAWDSWMAPTIWDAAALRTLLLAIAEDREAHIAFVSDVTDCVYVPYDGGADGFTLDSSRWRRLAEEFAAWRSSHSDGL